VVVRHGDADVPLHVGPVTGVVYIPGLLADTAKVSNRSRVALMDLVESLAVALVTRGGWRRPGGRRSAVVDWLGWPSRPACGCRGCCIGSDGAKPRARARAGRHHVNAVIADSARAPPRGACRTRAGTHLLRTGAALTGEPVTPEDIAAAVAFFLDPRSGYITGQSLHCCGERASCRVCLCDKGVEP
jgi:hypothetical protein